MPLYLPFDRHDVWHRSRGEALPQAGTNAFTLDGINALTSTGTLTTATYDGTSIYKCFHRVTLVSGTAAASIGGFRVPAAGQLMRGSVANAGGFYAVMRFGIAAFQTNARGYVGLYSSGAIADVDPTTLLNVLGIGFGSGQTTWHLINNAGSGTGTSTDLGASFPVNTSQTDMYQLEIWCNPDDSGLSWRLTRLNTGDVASGYVTTNIPSNVTGLSLEAWISNGASGSAAVSLDLCHLYYEGP